MAITELGDEIKPKRPQATVLDPGGEKDLLTAGLEEG